MPEKKKEEHLPFIRTDLFVIPPSGEPYLVGNKCNKCGRVFFPRRAVCCDCMEEGTMQDIPLSRKGKIHAGALVHDAPLGFTAPYAVARVDLPDGVRVFTQIEDAEKIFVPGTERMIAGAPVELVVEKIREDDEGRDVIGFKFRALQEA